jgi:hypothetical protein
MFYVTQVLEPLLYYCNITVYFHKICNYLQQYKWHDELVEIQEDSNCTYYMIIYDIFNYYSFCKKTYIPYDQNNYIQGYKLNYSGAGHITIAYSNCIYYFGRKQYCNIFPGTGDEYEFKRTEEIYQIRLRKRTVTEIEFLLDAATSNSLYSASIILYLTNGYTKYSKYKILSSKTLYYNTNAQFGYGYDLKLETEYYRDTICYRDGIFYPNINTSHTLYITDRFGDMPMRKLIYKLLQTWQF